MRIIGGINSTVLAASMGHESSTIAERRYIHLFKLTTENVVPLPGLDPAQLLALIWLAVCVRRVVGGVV